MNKFKAIFLGVMVLSITTFSSCKKGDLNLFSLQDDITLGQQTRDQVLNDPSVNVLSKTTYATQYAYLNAMRDKILNSGKVQHKADFEWELYIIKDDATLNAFCTPGGYIFVYSGLIKYLDKESSLAGVLGHEMAHADYRHSTTQMTKQYGLQTLLDIVLGNSSQSQITQVATSLINLTFSRGDETAADKGSVTYLCPTTYNANGAADFFAKLIADPNYQSVPTFLSTHPDPGNRVNTINTESTTQGCGTKTETTTYTAFKNSL